MITVDPETGKLRPETLEEREGRRGEASQAYEAREARNSLGNRVWGRIGAAAVAGPAESGTPAVEAAPQPPLVVEVQLPLGAVAAPAIVEAPAALPQA